MYIQYMNIYVYLYNMLIYIADTYFWISLFLLIAAWQIQYMVFISQQLKNLINLMKQILFSDL